MQEGRSLSLPRNRGSAVLHDAFSSPHRPLGKLLVRKSGGWAWEIGWIERDAEDGGTGRLTFAAWNVGRAKMQSSGSMHCAMADVSVVVSFSLDHRQSRLWLWTVYLRDKASISFRRKRQLSLEAKVFLFFF